MGLTHEIKLDGKHETLGLNLITCPQRNLPKLQLCIKGTPSARIPKWRSTIKHSYIHSINHQRITSVNQVVNLIKRFRQQNAPKVQITFATLHKTAVHPEKGVPQLYFDQLRSISNHISDIKYNEETINKMGGLTRLKLQQLPD